MLEYGYGDAIICSCSVWCNGKTLLNFSASGISHSNNVWGNFSKQDGDDFQEGLNSDSHNFLIYIGTLMTEEQIKAHHDFLIRRYYINADPVE